MGLNTVEDVEICGLPLGMRAVSAEGVAEALEKLHREPEYRRHLAAAGYHRATRPEYRWSEIARRWDRLFLCFSAFGGVPSPFSVGRRKILWDG